MGEHARRATRRRKPLIAAAAGVGTVAAMLAGPLPANAAAPAFVLDPNYGGLNGAPKGVATAGLPNAVGVDAKNLTVSSVNYRYVLSQQNTTGTPAAFLTRFDASGRPDTAFGTSGRVSLTTLPSGATVSKLLTDGTSLYVVAQSGLNLYVAKLDNTGTQVSSGWGTSGLATIATGLPSGSSYTVADAKIHTVTGPAYAMVIALNGQATGAPQTGAWLVRLTTAGVADPTFNTGATTTGVWPVVVGGVNALSVGGIAPRPLTDTTTTGIMVAATLPPEASTTNDTQSAIFNVPTSGAITVAASAANAFETYADGNGISYEQVADINSVGATAAPTYLISGRTSTGYFVARYNNAGTALDTAFGVNGVSTPVTASCVNGLPQMTQDSAGLIYLAADRTCANNMPEIVRLTATGTPDSGFNQGSAVWSPNIPVNSKSLTVTGASTQLNFGAGSSNDAAAAQAIPTSAPTATTPISLSGAGPFTSGQQITLNSTPGGAPTPNLQWQWAGAGTTATGTWNNIPDATGPYYTFRASLAQSGYQYRVIATNQYGVSSAPTSWIQIAVYAGAPTVTSQPQNKTISAGSPVSFTVGWAAEPDATVQWQASANNGGSWSNVAGATGPTLTIPAPPLEYNGFQYRAVVTNPNGVAYSNPATLLVTPPVINISKQPMDQTVAEGKDAMFSVTANGNGALLYQWQWSKTGADNSFTNVPNATSPSWTWPNVKKADDGTVVQVKITDLSNNVEYSKKAKLTVSSSGGHEPEPGTAVWGDYNGDGKTDIASFKDGSFWWNGSSPESFGKPGDKLVVGNFDSDAAADKAVVRGNTWMTDGNPNVSFGKPTDWPVSGDFDGDGKTDIAVWRPSNGTWYVNGGDTQQWGQAGDIPVPGDYDGDGSDEFAVFRPSNGTWYIYGVGKFAHGRSGDIPVRGDWNGDGTTDITVYRPSNSTWYPRGGASVTYGAKGDVPLSGDFDGDSKSDIAVYRPSNGTWFFRGKPQVTFGQGWWPVTGNK